MKLSPQQERAIRRGSPKLWLACAQNGVRGDTMDALERRGLAEVSRRGRAMTYRLTAAGAALRAEWAIDEATTQAVHVPVPVRCTHCGQRYPDGTDGGSCGACGLEVRAEAEGGAS